MFRRIIVVMDGNEDSLSAATEACALAKIHESDSVTLVTVLSERQFSKATKKGVEEQAALSTKYVSKAMELLDATGVTNELVLLNGKPAEEIGRYALETNADLLIVGSKYFKKVAKSVGSAGKTPTDHKVDCPVMVVKVSDLGESGSESASNEENVSKEGKENV